MSVTLGSARATSSRRILDSKQLVTSADDLAGRFDDVREVEGPSFEEPSVVLVEPFVSELDTK
jgi:hypothetical protein